MKMMPLTIMVLQTGPRDWPVIAAVYLVWLAVSAGLTAVLLLCPARPSPRMAFEKAWIWHLVRGDMALGGSLRCGLGVSVALWWCVAAGLLTSDVSRGVLVLTAGALVLIALINAGRRASLPVFRCVCLSASLGAGLMLWLLMAVQLWGVVNP